MKSQLSHRRAFRALVVWGVWSSTCGAILVVDPARPITHQVNVQIIETALSNGTSPATIFGNATQRAAIETAVDRIWAQAGIDIAFLPNILRYNNTFAYQGNGGTRPDDDLGRIISNAMDADMVNRVPSVINMFFVNVVPGFGFTSENTANGIANIGNDGIAQFVGDGLLTFGNGLDLIASVVAHEIGHNLGLMHTGSSLANLMSPGGTSEQLSSEQIAAVFQTTRRHDSVAWIPTGGTGFPQPISVSLTGDFNRDGNVNAVDIDWLALAAHNGSTDELYDLNDDEQVTFAIGPRGTQTPSDSDVLIREILNTEYGDLDLDGEVYLDDLITFATHYRQPGLFGWAQGNINGSQEPGTAASPRVSLSDLIPLATNWRFGVSGSGASIGGGVVPEPRGWLIAVLGALAALVCRSRSCQLRNSRNNQAGSLICVTARNR